MTTESLDRRKGAGEQTEDPGVERRCTRLLALPPGRRRLLLQRRPGLAGAAVAKSLIDRAHALRSHDPNEGLRVARAALQVLAALDVRGTSRAVAFDLRAEAWAVVGNLRRLLENYDAADKAFRHAASFVRQGSGTPLLAARVCDLEASLRRSQRRFAEALDLLGEAQRLYQASGEPHSAGRALLKAAQTHEFKGDVTAALDTHFLAGRSLDFSRERAVNLAYLHNLVGYLVDAGQLDLAARVQRQMGPLYAEVGSEPICQRAVYLMGRIAAHQGRWAVAAEALEAARQGFLEQGLAYVASITTLDLALARLHLRQHREVFRLARETYDVFVAKEIPREASAAFLLFVKAAEEYQASAEVIAEVFRRLEAVGEPLPPGARRPPQPA